MSRNSLWIASFPLTLALSLGEREPLTASLWSSVTGCPIAAASRLSTKAARHPAGARLVQTRPGVLPLPEGEGRGEGKRDAQTQVSALNAKDVYKLQPLPPHSPMGLRLGARSHGPWPGCVSEIPRSTPARGGPA